MADKDQSNDEYQFAELDSSDNESMGQAESDMNKKETARQGSAETKDVRRNALIVIIVVFAIFFTYRFILPMFSHKDTVSTIKPAIPSIAQTTPQPVAVKPTPAPVQQVQPVVHNVVDNELKKNVSVIEINQQSIRSEVTSLSNQVTSVNNKIDDLTNQMSKLNQALTSLSNQVAMQSHEMSQLIARSQPKRIKPKVVYHNVPPVTYNIQAVIPGRAWIIGSNGSILTVREGIKIRGYGVVQLIDPMQGRVVTSSGKIIRFSPEDS